MKKLLFAALLLLTALPPQSGWACICKWDTFVAGKENEFDRKEAERKTLEEANSFIEAEVIKIERTEPTQYNKRGDILYISLKLNKVYKTKESVLGDILIIPVSRLDRLSTCSSVNALKEGEIKRFILYKNEQNFYIADRCIRLFPETWKKLEQSIKDKKE